MDLGILFLWWEYYSYNGNCFFWQEFYSWYGKFILLFRNFNLVIYSFDAVTGILFLRQEFYYCGWNFILLTEILWWWWEIYSLDIYLILITGTIFFWQEIYLSEAGTGIYSCEMDLFPCILLKSYFCGSSNKDFAWGLTISCQTVARLTVIIPHWAKVKLFVGKPKANTDLNSYLIDVLWWNFGISVPTSLMTVHVKGH